MLGSILTSARMRLVLTAVATAASANVVVAQQSDLSISPFVSILPSGGNSPLAGLALTLGGGSGFAIRGSAHLALDANNTPGVIGATTSRPWGADADAMLFLGGHSWNGTRPFAPFVFAGIGTAGTSTQTYQSNRSNWSYGAGATLPLAGPIDLFGESRWRMSEFVLPTASEAPSPTTEFRFGLTFHVASR